MCFGLKAAPLIWCRLAAAISQCLAGMFETWELMFQLYLDDPLAIVAGSKEQRRYLITMFFLTIRMLGIQMAWHKTDRGATLVWIGVQFYLNVEQRTVEVTLPEKTLNRLREEAESMRSQSVVGLARLRTFTGQLCWVSGVLPRIRWVVRVL